MHYTDFHGFKASLLGMGCMRLPLDEKGEVDVQHSIDTIRKGIDEGITYVDTAYVYHNGFSERVLGMALKDGYREKVLIADKMPLWETESKEDLDRILDKQLSRLGVECIDIYLVHSVEAEAYDVMKDYEIDKWLDQKKAEGKIKYAGFSFHDDYELFEEIVDYYDWDMCQIQYNYIDENYQAGRKGLDLAQKKGLPVVIMEPLKGGRLAGKMPPQIEPMWADMSEGKSYVDWAFRWVADHPQVMTILSGMSSLDQMEDNIRIFRDIEPCSLKEEDKAELRKIADKFNSLVEYGCTACQYCMPCPKGINIPKSIAFYNQLAIYDNTDSIHEEYSWMEPDTAKECVTCRKCENVCPQSLPISDIMKKCVEKFGY